MTVSSQEYERVVKELTELKEALQRLNNQWLSLRECHNKTLKELHHPEIRMILAKEADKSIQQRKLKE